jgi:hypothetical protein
VLQAVQQVDEAATLKDPATVLQELAGEPRQGLVLVCLPCRPAKACLKQTSRSKMDR